MELSALIKPAITVVRHAIKFVPLIISSIINYNNQEKLKLKISFSQKHFLFKDSNKIKHDYSFPCIVLENTTSIDYKINPSSIYINKETYSGRMASNTIFNRCNEGTSENKKLTPIDTNSIFTFYHKNWSDIAQNNSVPLLLPAHSKIILPINPYKNPNSIIGNFNGSKLWFSPSKISFRIKVNSTNVEYGINRKMVYEHIINWLSYWENNLL